MAVLLKAVNNEIIYYIEQIKSTGSYSTTTNKKSAHDFKTIKKANNVLNSLPKLLKKYNWISIIDDVTANNNSESLGNYKKDILMCENTNDFILNINKIIENYSETVDEIIEMISSFMITINLKNTEYEALKEKESLLDKELVDIRHLIEFNNLSASQGYCTYKIQQEKLQERRYIKNLIFVYQQFLSLFNNEKMVHAILSIKGLETQKYTPRSELYNTLLKNMKGERCDD